MRRAVYAFATILIGTMFLTTGCTTKKRHERDFTNLQTQIGSLQGEVARLDQSLRDTETTLKSAQKRGTSPATSDATSGSVFGELNNSGAVYRTPSGFEIPVVALQRALKNAGYYQGTVDGRVGSGTKQAIRNFQKDRGLNTDGVCGRQTWAQLKSFA